MSEIPEYYPLVRDDVIACDTAARLTDFNTIRAMYAQKKSMTKYAIGSPEYAKAKAFNEGVDAVISIYEGCFWGEDADEIYANRLLVNKKNFYNHGTKEVMDEE